jgi:serine/threonine protein kinase
MTSSDDDATIIRSSSGSTPASGPDLFPEPSDALPPGARLHEFEVLSVIGQGGFGIVYLAQDHSLGRRVAIKEYLPSALATRTQAMTVAVRATRHAETFDAGLRSFVNEARLLAQFDHPSLLKVHRFWEAHGTAYMVMPYYQGKTLSQVLANGDPPEEALLRRWLDALLEALAQMHAACCYHRDIAPDNILILPDGRPLLLDFGAARHVISGMTHAPTVILKTGYAPVEQYGELPGLLQGAWTDLYALGSVVEFAITGHTPPQAVTRYLADKRVPLHSSAAGPYSPAFLRAIDASLAVLPKDRPQTTAQFRALMGPLASAGPVTPASAPVSAPIAAKRRRSVYIGTGVAVLAAAVLAGWAMTGWRTEPAVAVVSPTVVAVPAPPVSQGADAAPVNASDNEPDTSEPAPPPTTASTPALTPTPTATATPTVVEAPPVSVPVAPPPAAAVAPPAAVPLPSQPTPSAQLPRSIDPARPALPAGPTRATDTARPADAPPRSPPATGATSARCAEIIQRASLGEEPNAADKSFLTKECRP